MNARTRKFASTAPLLALLLAFTSCSSSKSMSGTETESMTATSTGAIVVETFTAKATVTAIDAPKRKVTLTFTDGTKNTFKVDPSVPNFDQLQVGDQVTAMVTEQVAVAVIKQGGAPMAAGSADVALAPTGAKPGVVMTATVTETAEITAIDASKRKITFVFADGSKKTYKVSDSIDLSKLAVGDDLYMQVTEGVAITVVKG